MKSIVETSNFAFLTEKKIIIKNVESREKEPRNHRCVK